MRCRRILSSRRWRFERLAEEADHAARGAHALGDLDQRGRLLARVAQEGLPQVEALALEGPSATRNGIVPAPPERPVVSMSR
jgi:hypothetical protein